MPGHPSPFKLAEFDHESPSADMDPIREFIRRLERHGRRSTSWHEVPSAPAADDYLGLLQWAAEAARFRRRHLAGNYSAEPGDAVRDDDEENPGRHKVVFRTMDGTETCYRNLVPAGGATGVPQSGGPCGASRPAVALLSLPAVSLRTLGDPNSSPEDRTQALGELFGTDAEVEAVLFIADELGRRDLPPGWRDAVVFAAEDVHFPADLREQVADRLLVLAADLRDRADAPAKVVWSALRRGASLLPAGTAGRLLCFLAPGGAVDTRAVALRAVTRAYEGGPAFDVPAEVVDRSARLAERFLDPDVFAAGEPSLIARNAVTAVAALGDSRLAGLLDAVRRLDRAWLTRRVRVDLTQLARDWQTQAVPPNHPAVQNLNQALPILG